MLAQVGPTNLNSELNEFLAGQIRIHQVAKDFRIDPVNPQTCVTGQGRMKSPGANLWHGDSGLENVDHQERM